MFVRVFLVSSMLATNHPDPVPLSGSKYTLSPHEDEGYGFVNVNCITSVYPFDGDLNSDRCLINTSELHNGNFISYVSDDFQKLKNHFYLEF